MRDFEEERSNSTDLHVMWFDLIQLCSSVYTYIKNAISIMIINQKLFKLKKE